MKVYKVVPYHEVESHTVGGWELDRVLGRSSYEKPPPKAPAIHYLVDSQLVPDRGCPVVYEPLFLLCKDHDVMTREEFLLTQVKQYLLDIEELKKLCHEWEQVATQRRREAEGSKDVAMVAREQQNEYATRSQRLESDLGKLRASLGPERMKEILGG